MGGGRATIVALSSGALPSGIAVIRLSGPRVQEALRRLVGSVPQPRRMTLRALRAPGGAVLDTGLVVFFPGPGSFTGEDCAELHLHGSRAVVAAVLAALCAIDSVELAEAGAFTRRAFEAGRLDLTQVEGIGDLIAAETETQRLQAIKRSQGALRSAIADWRQRLVALRAEIEARLDFADEGDVGEVLPDNFHSELGTLEGSMAAALAGYADGRIVRDGFRVVLAGAPNAGKSSLLNALAGSEEAIVSPEAGTTRDVKEIQLDLGGRLVRLFDVAGLRQSASAAESEGVRRAEMQMRQADLVLWLEAPDVNAVAMPEGLNAVWRIASKADLGGSGRGCDIALSCRTGAGLSELKHRLGQAAASAIRGETALVSHMRDKESIEKALGFLAQARAAGEPDEFLAENLRLAGQALMRLTGEIEAEQVLDRLFAGFCIGK
ncbi:MAG: tRNA uridine-5-carboxymethylaminomethyl(34) synthesis GTPase MnmE [Alphaproteobacteria bacterium]|nr:tRNA uridine-5-carboxymethylaminomethyl(34) synthesis GTPase MnmE [Alphaproteobacteria bacterium]